MAKVKRIPAVFDPQTPRFAFGGIPVTATAEPIPKVEKKTRTKTPTLRSAFNELVKDEMARTKFDRERIEFYLPPELLPLFRTATFVGGSLPCDEKGQEFLTFVKDKIFGVLPDFKANATAEHIDGFNVNGKVIDMNMCRETVQRQMTQVTNGIDQGDLMRLAEFKLKEQFSPRNIRDAVCGSGNAAISRKLVASLMVIASEMK